MISTNDLESPNHVTRSGNYFSHIGFPNAGALSKAPIEVTQELTSLVTTLHENLAPNYRPREIILELLATLEKKSPLTAAHSMRVATVARILSRARNMDITAVERISLAALLHDVGKLVIPNHILNKKHALSDSERRCIQTHALFTDVILSAFPVFDAIRGIATLHHEHLNGTGYPFGCADTSIPIETRIITVADIFVALTEDRPYRPGVANAAALHKLRTLAREEIVDANVVACARQNLTSHDHSSAVWYPSRTSISIALDFDKFQPTDMYS